MGRKKVVKKKQVASPIFENAIDSLRIARFAARSGRVGAPPAIHTLARG
jgi:hypothetical protein